VGAGDAEHPQGFDGSVLAFRDAGASAVQGGSGCIDRVEIVVLAFAAAVGPVGPVDLQDLDAGFGEVSGQAGQ
jgi:hypothetical protein